jgi:hypothetical protein
MLPYLRRGCFQQTHSRSCCVALRRQVVNLVTNRVVKIIGKVENTERFLSIALYQVRAFIKDHSTAA